jgi:hypothetical protein
MKPRRARLANFKLKPEIDEMTNVMLQATCDDRCDSISSSTIVENQRLSLAQGLSYKTHGLNMR